MFRFIIERGFGFKESFGVNSIRKIGWSVGEKRGEERVRGEGRGEE